MGLGFGIVLHAWRVTRSVWSGHLVARGKPFDLRGQLGARVVDAGSWYPHRLQVLSSAGVDSPIVKALIKRAARARQGV